jgi:dynein heavy chain
MPPCISQAHEMPLGEPFESSLTRFQRLLVLRCLRPDRVLAGVRAFVVANLGQRFIEPPPFDLAACFKESSPATPLLFVLSPGEGWCAVHGPGRRPDACVTHTCGRR